MRKEPEVRKEKGFKGTESIIDAMGERRPTYWIGGVRYIALGAYNSLYTTLYDRTEELAAANKALAEEREAHEDTKKSAPITSRVFDGMRKQKNSLFEESQNLERLLAAAREEIEALLADMEKLGAIHNDLAVHLNEMPGIPIDFEGKRKEVCNKIYDILIKYAPFFAERSVPAPAPVEYACPYCKVDIDDVLSSDTCMCCPDDECGAGSPVFDPKSGPHESWIKKQEEPTA